MPHGRNWLIVLGFLAIGAAVSCISLVDEYPTFCTARARGWPLEIVDYPCLCTDREHEGQAVWDPLMFAANSALFAIPMMCLFAGTAALYRRRQNKAGTNSQTSKSVPAPSKD